MKRLSNVEREKIIDNVNQLPFTRLRQICTALAAVNQGFTEAQLPVDMDQLPAGAVVESGFDYGKPFYTAINVDNDAATSLSTDEAEVVLRNLLIDNVDLLIENIKNPLIINAFFQR